jgi:hypothetical protein
MRVSSSYDMDNSYETHSGFHRSVLEVLLRKRGQAFTTLQHQNGFPDTRISVNLGHIFFMVRVVSTAGRQVVTFATIQHFSVRSQWRHDIRQCPRAIVAYEILWVCGGAL